MAIATYFSHSYRREDQKLNRTFWSLFSDAGFAFAVDPPSEATVHTHLERMMDRCSAFVAVINRRVGEAPYFCSRFILYEYGLSIQARRPRLLLIDRRIPGEPFKALPSDEVYSFSEGEPLKERDELLRKIHRLQRIAEHFPNRDDRPRGAIALLVPPEDHRCAYRASDLLAAIQEAAQGANFQFEVREIPDEFNALFALDLDSYEALILDVRGPDLPEWVFAYVYGRLIPTIKLARVLKKETPDTITLPPIVMGLRMDENEPGVESVTYWRDVDLAAITRFTHARRGAYRDQQSRTGQPLF
jgi:hypothetical protein